MPLCLQRFGEDFSNLNQPSSPFPPGSWPPCSWGGCGEARPAGAGRGAASDRRLNLLGKEQRKQRQTLHQNERLARMDEERKTPAAHDEMCFPDWLNEARGIKGVNQPLRCLGSTWAGLLMRQDRARLAVHGGPQTAILRRLRGWPDLWPRPRSPRGQGGLISTRPHCSPFKRKAALRKWAKSLFRRYNPSESCRKPQTEVAWASVCSKCHLSPPPLAHVSSSSSPYPHVCCPWLPGGLAHH